MAAMFGLRSQVLLLLLPLCVLLLLQHAAISALASPGSRRDLLAYVPAARRMTGGGEAAAKCRAMATRRECLRSSKWCRWCRSDALDDMCFGSAEAWRLPSQVFSCEAPTVTNAQDD